MARVYFQQDLDNLVAQVIETIKLVENSMGLATQALLDADQVLAEKAIDNDAAIDVRCREIEGVLVELQMRQQPVASDLRLLLATQRILGDLERSGALAKNVAKQVRRRYPDHVVPERMRETVAEMGDTAVSLLNKAGLVFAEQDEALARELEADDDHMDTLHRALLQQVIAGTGTDPVETTVDLTLCGRYYERFADHAVAIARQVIYRSTGELA